MAPRPPFETFQSTITAWLANARDAEVATWLDLVLTEVARRGRRLGRQPARPGGASGAGAA